MALNEVICVVELSGSERCQHEDWMHGGKVVMAVRRRPIALQLAEEHVKGLDADSRLSSAEVREPERQQADCTWRVEVSSIRHCRVIQGSRSLPLPEASLS